MTPLPQLVEKIFRLPHNKMVTNRSLATRMAEFIIMTGDGDHLEIGVMHGATLILAALVKKEYGLKGDVIGIDPLSGYYPASPLKPEGVYSDHGKLITSDNYKGIPIIPEILFENIDFMGLRNRITIIQNFSHPFPDELKDSYFASVYIDGDHYKDGPTNDWLNVYNRTSKYIWFDDCNAHCPAVLRAREVANNTEGWHEKEYYAQHLLLMERDGIE